MMDTAVLAVIPVFGRDDVMTTVPRLLAWNPELCIVVVDNGNTPARAARLASLARERVEVVRLNENRGGSGGFIAGMKRALARADCEFVWLLDDDAEPNEETLPGLVGAFRELVGRGERVASVGSAIVRKNETDFIVECGALYLTGRNLAGITRILNGESLRDHPKEILPVEYCAACSCLVPRTALEQVGLWEDVFIHYDDVEWGLRAEHAFGLRNFATTASTVSHPERQEKVDAFVSNASDEVGTIPSDALGTSASTGAVAADSNAWLQYYDMYNKLWLDRAYAPGTFARECFLGRLYECFARLFFLNRGKYYAYRLIMADFRAGRRRRRAEVATLFAAHGICGRVNLLSLPRWYVWLRNLI